MVIEKESERPALALHDGHEIVDRFWAIYCPEYNEFGSRGEYVGVKHAEKFATIDDARKARKEYGYLARVAFVEVTVNVHYNEEEEERS